MDNKMVDAKNNNNDIQAKKGIVSKSSNNAWYIRKKDQITGPFPSGQISQLLVVGRLTIDDQVSHDKDNWLTISDIPSLIPDVLSENQDENHPTAQAERLAAARRWADERREERRDESADSPSRNSAGRRHLENTDDVEYRHRRESIYKQFRERPQKGFFVLTVLVIAVIGIVWGSFNYEPLVIVDEPNCTEAPRKGVNWRNCNKSLLIAIRADISESNLHSAIIRDANLFASDFRKTRMDYIILDRANLSYANFEKANLKGGSLIKADLQNANFKDTNLTYVNFTGATILNTNFDKADLSHATWINGERCMAGSIGHCKK